jgi:phage head maturation protease
MSNDGPETRDFSFRVNAKSLDDAGTFVGLASTYGPPPDLVGDVVEHGAFRQAIQNQGKGIPLLWAHSQLEPLGLAKISDSPAGLTVNGSLPVSGPENASYSDDGATRTLKSVRLFEISLCAVPAAPGALVQSVKSLVQVETVMRKLSTGSRDRRRP